VKITTAMLNDLYLHTLHSDFGLFYKAAFALSIEGGEEERKKDTNYIPINPPYPSHTINYDDKEVVNAKLQELLSAESQLIENIENGDDYEDCESVAPSERDVDYSSVVKDTKVVSLINSE
jgi:hypothetical protein